MEPCPMSSRHTGTLRGASDHLKASYIRRWGIVHTATEQSIATHMYRVWMLIRMWGPAIGLDKDEQYLAESWALVHDLAEIRTGDMPTPHKTPIVKQHLKEVEASICPAAAEIEEAIEGSMVADFCKLCDTAEAVLFLKTDGIGAHAREVRDLLYGQMLARLERSQLTLVQQEAFSELFTTTYDES